MTSLPLHILPLVLALAGASGLRAFLPLFYLSLATRIGLYPISQISFQVRDYVDPTSNGVLAVLGILALVEIAAEMVPRIAAMLDVPMLLLRIVSAICVSMMILPMKDLSALVTAAMVSGFIGAISVLNLQVRPHGDDVVRLPSYINFASALSLTAICLAVISISLQLPYVGLAILYPGTWLTTLVVHRWTRSVESRIDLASLPVAPEMPEEFLGRGRSERTDA